MKISLAWLNDFVELDEDIEQISHMLTMSGLEVEGIEEFETIAGGLKGLVIGEVMECGKHPNADKLSVTKVDIGESDLSPIVCGAPNVAAGQKVVVATVGTNLFPTGGESFKIKKSKIRGEVSQGMICAEDEIGLGTDHDGIMVLDTDLPNGTPASEYFQIKSDQVIEIGLTPNRADAASHFGVARDLKVLFNKPIQFPNIEGFKPDNHNLEIPVEVENTEACPRYSGVTLTNITVKPSPDWLQNRLKAIGLTPINNVVDVTNFVLHGLGQPLHAFDADEIEGGKIIVKTLPEGTPFITLDEKERKLKATDLMICNTQEPMCIGGVFGGLKSGVSEKTTNVFIEGAYFSPDYIRRTSMVHTLKTDAAFRFERGTDPNGTVDAVKYAALLIKELAGGEISSDIVDVFPQPIENFEVSIRYKNVNRLIGKDIAPTEVKSILTGLEIEIKEEKEDGLLLSVPPYRVDVKREADVIEEILRIHGFESIEVQRNMGTGYLANFPVIDKDALQQRVSEMLAGAGAQEIMTNSLTSSQYAEKLGSVNAEENVQILNMLSADLDVMRQSLIFSGLEVVAHNLNRRQNDLKLFEFGKTYAKKGEKYTEKKLLGIYVTGNKSSETWGVKSEKADFHTVSILVQKTLNRLGYGKIENESLSDPDFAYGLALLRNNKQIARLGLLQPKLAKQLDIKQEVFYAELDWDYLVKNYKDQSTFKEISKFPEVRKDLSLVLNKSVTFESVKKIALKTERKILKDINVFDIYEGDNLGEGKKSYSVSFMLQDETKTLNDKAIAKTMNRLMDAFERELGAEIKGRA